MAKYYIFVLTILCIGIILSFTISPDLPAGEKVKKGYHSNLNSFVKELKNLQQALKDSDEKQIQVQFLKARHLYKINEAIIEYFFSSYALYFNGPPIPFFEESEPYKIINDPYGLQVIEGLIFSAFDGNNKKELKIQIDELLRHAIELTEVNEAIEFNDANIFDAFIEEIYRITALGLTGIDSQSAQNALPECVSSLQGLLQYLNYYEPMFNEKMPGKFKNLEKLINDACKYISENNDFNRFNRLTFITQYLNPITTIIGEYKIINNLPDNSSGYYYSSIKKNNTLFNAGAFNPNRFIDDFTTTPQKVEFGRQLFFEKMLSLNNKQSCAGCHKPEKAFTDGLKTSEALDGHTTLKRNAPTLWNASLQRNLFADSRSRNLEDQVLQVLNNSLEMHGSAKTVAKKILSIDKYKDLYSGAYPPWLAADTVNNICNAIACFERILIALNSKFDKHMNGNFVMSKNEINGFNIFMGKAKCGTCHFMPLFSGAKPPRYYYIESEVLGVPNTTHKKHARLDSDSGRYLITQSPIHLFSFKTPSLRNVALTAPYMHNGVFNTLEEVVDFYNTGGGRGLGIAPSNQTLPFEKLNLTKKEKKDLILFMKTLTDTTSSVYSTFD